jgi:hypothetical protein
MSVLLRLSSHDHNAIPSIFFHETRLVLGQKPLSCNHFHAMNVRSFEIQFLASPVLTISLHQPSLCVLLGPMNYLPAPGDFQWNPIRVLEVLLP